MSNLNLYQLLRTAIVLAVENHSDQFDKGGQPYIFHPLRVMLNCDTLEQKVVAVLHDVVEDCFVGVEDSFYRYLSNLGFPERIIIALNAISKRRGEKNKDYWARIKCNDLATAVKLKDMEDNSSPSRLNVLPYGEQEYLIKKYAELKAFLGK